MEKTDERRTEHRLQYRWPVKFFIDGESQTFNGQLFDISSSGMSFLCHADQSSLNFGQKLKTSFAVPHFENNESFDTVLFERNGYVCRIDKPSSQVYRIAMQFASPLFFRPGEQGIDEVDIENKLDAKNFSVIKAEETARAYNEALTKAERQLRLYAQSKAKIEEQLKEEIEDRARYEARIRVEVEGKIRSYTEEIARYEAKLQSKEKEISRLSNIAELAEERILSLEKQLEKLKEQTDMEIDRVKNEAAEFIHQAKVKFKTNATQSGKMDFLKKFDKFISDKNKIF